MNIRNEIKAYIVREGFTMSELVEKLAERTDGASASPTSPITPLVLAGTQIKIHPAGMWWRTAWKLSTPSPLPEKST